eukprot:3230453-Ditylum_brightwellii.AAC.1
MVWRPSCTSLTAVLYKQEEPMLSASVYTQITDVELECDGFLNYDRTSKVVWSQRAILRDCCSRRQVASDRSAALRVVQFSGEQTLRIKEANKALIQQGERA